VPKAPKQTAVHGPSASSGGHAWHIEGRTAQLAEPSYGAASLADAGGDGAAAGGELVDVGTLDRGLIGARYRIRLRVVGKYRLVDWERLTGKPQDSDLQTALESATALPQSSYLVTGDFNGWGFQEMTAVPSEQSGEARFSLDLQLDRDGGEFQIVRNRDWDQVLYPFEEWAGCQDPSAVGGPDDESYGRTWFLDGRAGDRFRIELQRSRPGGRDEKQVSWTSLGNVPLTEAQLRDVQVPRFAVFGSWDSGQRLRGLRWTGSCHRFFVELGDDARADFQLVLDFDWDLIFHPSVANAHRDTPHTIRGPSPGTGASRGLNWTIGLSGTEAAGEVYEVRVTHEERSRGPAVAAVEWSRVAAGAAELAAAEAEGLVLRAPPRR